MNAQEKQSILAPITTNRGWIAVTVVLAICVSGCANKQPVLCLGTGPVAKADVVQIRKLAKEIATQTDAELTDVSEQYKTREVPAELSIGFALKNSEYEMTMLSAGTLTPRACFYSDNPQSKSLALAIQSTSSGLRSLHLPLTIENSRRLNELPSSLQEGIRSDITASAVK